MADYALKLRMPKTLPAASAARTFYWTGDASGSLITKTGNRYLGPGLGALGPVPEPNVEFVRLAAAVYAADRTMVRRVDGSDWSRRPIRVSVPVTDTSRWAPIRDRLQTLLGFLSGDDWTIDFTKASSPKEDVTEALPGPRRAVLLSGGADSAVGALVSRHELGLEPQVLVSHFGPRVLPPIQRDIAAEIARLFPGADQKHWLINLTRRNRQPNGVRFANEYSTRARSFVYLALGLAVASLSGMALWVPENGFASLNPPLGPDRRGSLSTRTTHPRLLIELTAILSEAGVHAELINPFERMTKGEMFRRAADLVGDHEASNLLGKTHSCAHTGHRAFGLSTRLHCGVCFGCVVRRAAFATSGLRDRTKYLTTKKADVRVARYLEGKSVERSIRDFIARGIRPTDIAALSLPAAYPGSEALDLCRRAIHELQALYT